MTAGASKLDWMAADQLKAKRSQGPEIKSQIIKGLRKVAQDFQSISSLSLTPGVELGMPHTSLWGKRMVLECAAFVTHADYVVGIHSE